MKRRISLLLIIGILLTMVPFHAFATDKTDEETMERPEVRAVSDSWEKYAASQFAGGSGTMANPYFITNAAELAYLAKSVNSGNNYSGKYIKLADDIDLSNKEWIPIGNSVARPFSGTFMGCGYTISGLTITSTSSTAPVGLFGVNYGRVADVNIQVTEIYKDYAGIKSQISNLETQDYSIGARGVAVGGAVGANYGTVAFVKVTGKITARYEISDTSGWKHIEIYLGGAVGANSKIITDCSFSGTLSGTIFYPGVGTAIGGLCGWSQEGSDIFSSWSSGNINIKDSSGNSSAYLVGGLLGVSRARQVSDCYSSVEIKANSTFDDIYVGGLIGRCFYTTVYSCYASGSIDVTSSGDSLERRGAGGLIGQTVDVHIDSCYTSNPLIRVWETSDNQTIAGKMIAYKYDYDNDKKTSPTTTNNCYVSGSTTVTRKIRQESGCKAQYVETHEGVHTDLATDGFTISENTLKNSLKWGIFTSVADTMHNSITNVWKFQNGRPYLYTELIHSLTIRYYDESDTLFNVFYEYYAPNEEFCITAPVITGSAANPEKVSGTISENTYVDVHYSHAHVGGAPATCTTEQYCVLCGAKMAEKTPHSYVETVTKPDCINSGYTTHTCSACGDNYEDSGVEPLGHLLNTAFKCTRCGKQLKAPPREYIVYVYDMETGRPVEDAAVTLGSVKIMTDANGAAKHQLEDNEERMLIITADSYPLYKNEKFIPGDLPSTYIYIASDESGIYEAWCNSDNVLLIESQINSNSPALKAKIVVKGRAKANILSYEIVQDNQVIATSTDGTFIIPNPYFKEGVPVYARMRTDGASGNNVFERELNISVVDFSFKLELSDLFPFSAGLNFDFTDGVPLLNGVEFQMPAYALGEDGIFNVTALNEKVLITFGLEKDYFDDGMDNKTIQEIWKAAKKKMKENSLNMNKKKSEVTITGALALEFGKDAQVTKAYAECHVGYEWSHKWGKTFVVWVIPVYVGFKTSFEGELVVTELGWDFENAEILVPDVDLTLSAEFAVYGGIGCALASVGLYGAVGGEIKTGIKDFEGYFRYKLYGEMGLYARIDLIFFKELEYRLELLHGEFTGPKGQVKKAILSPENYQTASRSYLENRSEWMEEPLIPKRGKNTTRTLQTSSYTAIEPQIVVSGDTVMMLFLDDDGSEGFNYQHLKYSLFDQEKNTWSAPKCVDDSAFADLEYDVYGDENGIYIAYTKAGDITEANQDDYAAIMATTEVYTARYDSANNCFIEHTNVSQNNSFDSQPQIAGETVVWVNNFTNDVYSQNANNVLMMAQKTGSVWQNSALDDHGATVTSMDLGVLEGKTYIALIRDVDCDLFTAVDRRLELMDTSGNVTVVTSTAGNEIMQEMYDENGEKYYLSEGDMPIESVRFECVDGQNVLQWCYDENIWQVSAVNGTPVSLLDEPEQGLTGEFKFVRIDDEKSMILYARNSVEDQVAGSSIYAVYYANGQWGKPVPLTETTPEVYVDAFDGCSYNGQLLMAYISTRAAITEEDITRTSNFMTSCIAVKDDLAAGKVEFVENELFEGSTIELQVPVNNLSWQKLHNVTVQVVDSQGTAVYTQSVKPENPLGSGQTEIFTVTLPKERLTSAEQYSVYVSTTDWNDDNETNNYAPLVLWYTDFEVSAQQMLHAGKQQIHYAVTNSGNTAGTGTLTIYKKVGTDRINLHEEEISLAVGRTHTAMVEITDRFYTDGSDGVVYVEIAPTTPEVYNFNNSQSLTLTTVKKTTTEAVPESQQAIPAPFVNQPYVIFDQHNGGNVLASVTENSWSFTGVKELDQSRYSYSGSKLTLKQDYLNTLPVGFHYYTLSYTLNGKTSDIKLILEIRNSGPAPAPLTVQDAIVTYDGAPVKLSELGYTTPSAGTATTRYSDGNGWLNGMPTEMGEYTVELTIAEDTENHYGAVTAQLKLTVIKGTRAISVPTQIKEENGRIRFDNSIPTAAANDGKIYYGYSTHNDAETVSQWSESGLLPQADQPTVYYVFAKITGGTKYGDAVSKGYAVDAHIHQYEEKVIPPTTAAEGYTLHTCKTCGNSYKDNFVEKLKYIRGDVNGDGYVTNKDAIYLLRYTLMPGRYPINQSGDMNGDGYVTNKDAIYLLRHTLMPGRYPLYE